MPNEQRASRRRAIGVLFGIGHLAMGVLLGGCGPMLYPWLQEPMKTVPAEYTGMPGHKLVIIVKAPESTEFADPDLGADLASYVEAALKKNVGKVSFVPRSQVLRYQETHARWTDTPATELGKHFGAEMVLALNVDYYTLTRPGDMYFQQGRLTCKGKLFDIGLPRGSEEVWNKDKLSVVYPTQQRGQGVSTEVAKTRSALLAAFAEKLSLCFVKHKEPAYEEQ